MMNKNKIYLVLIFIVGIILMPKDVFADTINYTSEDCRKALGLNVSMNPKTSNNTITGYDISINAKKGEWEYYVKTATGDSEDDDGNDNSEVDMFFKNDFETFGDTKLKPMKSTYESKFKNLSDSGYSKTVNIGTKAKYIYVFVKLKNKNVEYNGKNITCKKGTFLLNSNDYVKIKSTDNKTKKGTGYFGYAYLPGKGTVTNEMYATNACIEFRSGWYGTSQDNSANSKDARNTGDWTTKASNFFPYCFNTNGVTINFSQSKIRKIKKKFITIYNNIKDVKKLENSATNAEYDNQLSYLQNPANNYKQITTSNGNSSKDSDYSTVINEALSCGDDQKTSEEKKYYSSENKILDNGLCTVKCFENLSVLYDPPVTSSSGLCFSYKVTVKSKVYCKTEIDESKLEWPKGVNVCAAMGAMCDGSKSETQAGPTDEFDSCIKKCDGGKYTQSCIDECYVKTYGEEDSSETTEATAKNDVDSLSNNSNKNNTNSLVLYNNKNDNLTINKVSLKTNQWKQDKCEEEEEKNPYHYQWDDDKCINVKDSCDSYSDLIGNIDSCAKYYYNAKAQKPLGKYVSANSNKDYKYKWKIDDDVTKNGGDGYGALHSNHAIRTGANSVYNSVRRSAPYYMRSIAQTKSLLKSFYGVDSGKNGAGYDRYYNIDNNGIKRQKTTGWTCNEDCGFYPTTSGNVNTNCVSSVNEAMKHYEQVVGVAQEKVDACKKTAEASCSTTEATFDIGATNESESGKKTREKNADTNPFSNKNQSGNKNADISINKGGDDIFKKLDSYSEDDYKGVYNSSDNREANSNGVNGICYGNDYPYHHYKTTITFPGSCINKKSGNVSDEYQQCDSKGSTDGTYGTLFEDQYCLMYNSKNVNEEWWYHKVWGDEKYAKEFGHPYTNSTESRNYNIKSKITSFGKFNWNLNTQCFYGVYNNTLGLDDYIFKVIEIGKLFSNYETSQIPYNFTSKAKINSGINTSDNDAKTYSINPEKYVEYVNEVEKELFETTGFASSECPDCEYQVKLSGDDLEKIKKEYYNKNYTDYSGDFKEDPNIKGLIHYHSDVLNKLEKDYKLERNSNLGNKNNTYYNSGIDLYATN